VVFQTAEKHAMSSLQTAGLATATPRDQFVIRRAERDEIPQILAWAAAEGWNPGYNDADCFYQTDPEGFFLAELAGEPIGSLSAVVYDEAFAFLGCFIVRSEHRYCGFGMHLSQVYREHVGDRNAGLDGVVAMQRTYGRLGFQIAHRNIRFGGLAEGHSHPKVVGLTRLPLDEVSIYDRRHFPAARPDFLQAWIHQPGAAALGVMRDGHLAGYGVIRPCVTGYKIGPLFADDSRAAEKLYQSLCARVAGQPVFLDVPEPNREAVALAERHGLKPVFETARMYSGPVPKIALNEVFGITTYELG
jgi:GNAT superfamily N-acetyltransferase